MTEAQTEAHLQNIIRREGRSLLQYLSEAYPWTTPEEEAALVQFQQMVQEERDGIAALVRHLQRRYKTAAYLGPFPEHFTAMNFISLDHLLPRLVEAERQGIADLERDLNRLEDAEARQIIEKILETKRQHLKGLEALTAAHPPAATSRAG